MPGPAAPAPAPPVPVPTPARRAPTAAGQELSDLAAEAAVSLSVTDEALQKRKQVVRRKRLTMMKRAPIDDDAVRNLVDKGEDPNFFGFPFIWVQIAHVVLGGTAVAAALVGGQGLEFVLFDLQGEALQALRSAVTITVAMNVVIGAWLFYEELQLGPERVLTAVGWGIKGLLLGGVASWQRFGRMGKEAATKEAAQPL